MNCNNNNYANIRNLGPNTSTEIENPLTYCMNSELSASFLHGSSAHNYRQHSKPCQMFMSEYCAQGWDGFCEKASMNQTTYYPNNLNRCGIPGDISFTMSLGDALVRNTAKHKYLSKMIGGVKMFRPFDPNVANSPMLSYYTSNSNSCLSEKAMVPVFQVNPKTIDSDPVMNKILMKPQIAMDILINIYNTMSRNGTIGTLMGTKLGKFYQIHPYFQKK